MNNKDIQDVGETVAKNERKKRNAPARPSGGFDHKTFYDWVASRDFPVYFSSYQKISDKRFKMIWAAGKVNLLAGASGRKKNYECIYTNQAR